MKEKLIAMLKSLGLWNEEKKIEIESAIDQLTPAPAPAPSTPGASPELKALGEEVQALVEQNKQLFAALTAEKKAREDSQKTIADQLKAEQAKKVDATLKEYRDAGKLTPAKEEKWRKQLEADYDSALELMKDLPVDPAAKKTEHPAGGTPPAKTNNVFGLGTTGGSDRLKAITEFAKVSEN